jgi:carbamate kinase
MRLLIALGGNALARPGHAAAWAEAVRQMRRTAPALARLAAAGHELVLTHGNGPQVGQLLRQDEIARREVPFLPLPVLGAESIGQIGFLIQQELSPALGRAHTPRTVLPMVSRMEVAPDDPAFRAPSKPVGTYYSAQRARAVALRTGWTMGKDPAGRGWRRLLPSPRPRRWLEADAVRSFAARGGLASTVPVVAGGGGVPVVRRGRGRFDGVDAVIDKDRSAALVARALDVDRLIIVTDVPGAAFDYGTPSPRWIGRITAAELSAALRRGEFASGSMRPKVEAVLDFVRHAGGQAIITDIASLSRAVAGRTGTRVSV